MELAVHGAIAALCSAAAIALWNGADGSRRIAAIAVVLSTARVLQTLYWSTLPSHTVPGDEPLYAAVAVLIAVPTLLVLRRAAP